MRKVVAVVSLLSAIFLAASVTIGLPSLVFILFYLAFQAMGDTTGALLAVFLGVVATFVASYFTLDLTISIIVGV